jgi:hypothetical protein
MYANWLQTLKFYMYNYSIHIVVGGGKARRVEFQTWMMLMDKLVQRMLQDAVFYRAGLQPPVTSESKAATVPVKLYMHLQCIITTTHVHFFC